MKKIILTIFFILLSINVYSQSIEDITSAGLKFFLNSDKARYLSNDQRTGLSILENLLERQGERNYELEKTREGKTSININGNTQQVQILPGSDGGIYLVANNIVYPIDAATIKAIKNYSSPNNNYQQYNEKVYEGEYYYRTTISDLEDKVNLWNTPYENPRSLYVVPKNSIIYVLGAYDEDYYDVYVDGYRGYIFRLYLKRQR